jgi:CheY-like chemotaxis protein
MINQRVLIKLLTSLGCKAHACSNGQQCVDLFAPPADAPHVEDAHFDLVLMDIEM